MASYVNLGTGNFNTGATWGLVEANSLLDSEAGVQVLTTAFSGTRCTAFTPGAVVVDGIAVKLNVRTGTTGTMSIHLATNADHVEVAGTLVAINTADLPAATASYNDGGWIYFKFATPVTLLAATLYEVEVKTSSATMVSLWRDTTAGNVSRMLVTTTAAATPPAAASILHVMGAHISAGNFTTYTVTMNAIDGAILKYGSGTDASACLTISHGGTLAYGYTAATAYYLQLDGNLIVYNGGTLTIGTVANPIPRDGTAVLEFDPTADIGMGLIVRNYGTFTAQGLSRTVGKDIYSCKLNADEAINSTDLGVNTDTGWLDNDQIGIASTTRTSTQFEKGTLNGNAGASNLVVDGFAGAGGGLANAHTGSAPLQADVVLLTRNVRIRSTSATIMTYVSFGILSVINCDWVEFYYMDSVTGIGLSYCSLHDFEDGGITFQDGATVTYNVLYNVANVGGYCINCSTYLTGSIAYCIIIGKGTTGGVYLENTTGYSTIVDLSYITIANCTGFGLLTRSGTAPAANIDHITIYSCTSYGMKIEPGNGSSGKVDMGIWDSLKICRCNTYGIIVTKSLLSYGQTQIKGWTLINCSFYGNKDGHIYISIGNTTALGWFVENLVFDNCIFDGETAYTTPQVFEWYKDGGVNVVQAKFYSCSFGAVQGHASADFYFDTLSGAYSCPMYTLVNCLFGSTNEVSNFNASYIASGSFIKSTKHDQTTGAALINKFWCQYGKIETDLTYYNTAVPSMRLTPNSASAYCLESGSFKVNVNAGQTVTPTVYVRKSTVASGGALYNGSQPRLVVKRNDAVGITADTVIETQHVEGATANWEALTGTTIAATENGVMEFLIQCDGTVGFVNVDDFSAVVT